MQFDLIPVERVADDGAELVAPSEAGASPRGPGRPKGSKSRSTILYRDVLLQNYGNPLMRLGQIYSSDPKALAKYLGCKPVEALDIIRKAAIDAAPYVTPKLGPVTEEGETIPAVNIMIGGDQGGGGNGFRMGNLPIVESERNQQLNVVEDAPVERDEVERNG